MRGKQQTHCSLPFTPKSEEGVETETESAEREHGEGTWREMSESRETQQHL